MTETKAAFGEPEFLPLSTYQPFDIEEARRRQAANPVGPHLWIIPILYGLDDPEAALDDMILGQENFVGAGQIMCILCQVPYDAKLLGTKCVPDLTAAQRP